MATNRIAVVTVHGTNDTANELDGAKWFQRGSAFSTRLLERLKRQNVDAEIVPHLWDGANSERAREAGARSLARRVRELSHTHASVHVIGHSHGGNVANEAATMLGWKLRKRARPLLAGISTVGTPFFRVRLGGSLLMVAFLVLCLVSVLAMLAFSGILALLWPDLHRTAADYARDYVAQATAAGGQPSPTEIKAYADGKIADDRFFLSVFLVPAFLTPFALVVLPVACYQGVRSIRIQRKQNPAAKIFSIWHPHDEAISFLKRVEGLDLQAFKPGSFWRASGTSGLSLGVPAAFVLVIVAAGAALAFAAGFKIQNAHYEWLEKTFHFPAVAIFADIGTGELALVLAIAAVLTPALAFTVVYIITRLIHGVGGELIGRRVLNNVVGGALRGMAFGRDGDVKLDAVATHSHNYGVRPMELQGELADRMRTNADGAASALIDKHRWALFAVEPHRDALKDLSEDAMTWKSLIHTTYFDQPEVVDALADYVAECAERHAAGRE